MKFEMPFVLSFEAQTQIVIVLVINRVAVQRQCHIREGVALDVQVFNSSEPAAAPMLNLLHLRLVASRQKIAAGKLNPVGVGVRAALKIILLRHRRAVGVVGARYQGEND